MTGNRRLLISWLLGACLILGAFYGAVAWLWSAMGESRAAAMEREVVAALSSDLAEGNLFKLSSTLSKLYRDGHLRVAEIRRLYKDKNSEVMFRTPGSDDETYSLFSKFQCEEPRK